MVRDRDGNPQEDPLAVHCFCVCSRSALLGDLGVSRSRDCRFKIASDLNQPLFQFINAVGICQVHKGKGIKVHTLDIAPLRSESPLQKRSGMARVLKGFHSFTCTPTRSSAIGMSHACLGLPSYNWYSFTDP